MQQEEIKENTTEETSANEQEVREEATAEETTEAAEEKVEVVDEKDEKITVLDNFERAEASAEKTSDLESLLTGLKQIRRQFEDAFKELGVEEIVAQDAKFDPNLHEAVMRGQNPDMEDETIDMVFEKGYKLKDRVIRHSKVRVISNE